MITHIIQRRLKPFYLLSKNFIRLKKSRLFFNRIFLAERDFLDGFAKSLAICDELFLLDIYPARELPIPGIASQFVDQINLTNKKMSSKQTIVSDLKGEKREVILIIGAGDIDTCVKPITEAYK